MTIPLHRVLVIIARAERERARSAKKDDEIDIVVDEKGRTDDARFVALESRLVTAESAVADLDSRLKRLGG